MFEKSSVFLYPTLQYLDEGFVRKVQEIILWRRPLALTVLTICIELVFYSIYKLDLDFFSTVMYVIVLHNIAELFYLMLGELGNRIFFRPLPDDEPNSPNRIRNIAELSEIISKLLDVLVNFKKWLIDLIYSPTLSKCWTFFGISFAIFIVFSIFGSFWLCFFAVHTLLIIPGAISCPVLSPLLMKQDTNISVQEKTKSD